MSRSEEKAKASLNRWRQYSASNRLAQSESTRRVYASECNSLTECESKRKELIQSISAKVDEIQHVAPDEKCRKLNDDINKLMRIKGQWERQIRVLGGPDYRLDKTQRGNAYMYFGSAKELPEVRALYKEKESETLTTSLVGASKEPIDSSLLTYQYYGFDDEDLIALEVAAEREARKAAVENFDQRVVLASSEEVHWSESWKLPSKEDIDAGLLEFRKKELLRKYAL